MAFGKNPDNLNSIGTYGQASMGQQITVTSKRGRGGGGGKSRRPYWAGNFEMSESPTHPDRIRLLRGDYVQEVFVEGPEGSVLIKDSYPYLMIREHYHGGKKRGGICSGGPYYMSRDKKDPCEGCSHFWSEQAAMDDAKARGVQQRRAMSMTDKFVFSLFDYAYYFEMPQTDKHNQLRVNQRTGKPYTEWVKALNPQDPVFAGFPWKEGNTLPWLIGKQFLEVLQNYSNVVGMHCVSCGNQNCVHSAGWYCSNPACYALVASGHITEEQRQSLNGLHKCGSCQQMTYLQEVVQCSYCPNGKRASLFDVDLYAYQMRDSSDKRHLQIMGVSAPGPIRLTTGGDASKIAPLDLEKRFAPTDMDEQLEMWGQAPGTSHPQVVQSFAPVMPQPVTGSPVPPPMPSSPMLGQPVYPQQAPPQYHQQQQQYVDPNSVHAQLANMPGSNFNPQR
jgi:hypothetical protein